jgi:hypothetical protein
MSNPNALLAQLAPLLALFDADTLANVAADKKEAADEAFLKSTGEVIAKNREAGKARRALIKDRLTIGLKKKNQSDSNESRLLQRLEIASYILDESHRFLCCYINDRNQTCDKEGVRHFEELQHQLPFRPKFCTRHANLLDKDEAKWEMVQNKLEWVADLAIQVGCSVNNSLQLPAPTQSLRLPAPQIPRLLGPNQGPTVESLTSEAGSDMDIQEPDQDQRQMIPFKQESTETYE